MEETTAEFLSNDVCSELSELLDVAEQGEEALNDLASYNTFVQSVPGDIVSTESHKLLLVALENVRRSLGDLPNLTPKISLEEQASGHVSKEVALEAISNSARRIWEKLKAIIKYIKEAVVSFFKKLKEALFGVEKKLEDVSNKEVLKENEGQKVELEHTSKFSFFMFAQKNNKEITPDSVKGRIKDYLKLNELFLEYISNTVECYPSDITTQEELKKASEMFKSKIEQLAEQFKEHDTHHSGHVYKDNIGILQIPTEHSQNPGLHSRFWLMRHDRNWEQKNTFARVCNNNQKRDICKDVKELLVMNGKLSLLATAIQKTVDGIRDRGEESVDVSYQIAMLYQRTLTDISKACSINTSIALHALEYASLGTEHSLKAA